MSKIICDVCGTKYPDSAEQCPICGRVRVGEGKTAADSFVMDETETTARPKVKGGRFSKANVRKRNQNLPRYEPEEEKPKTKSKSKAKAKDYEEEYDEYEEFEPRKKSNVVINVLLAIVILALLTVIGYIVVEFFLPDFMEDEVEPPVTTLAATEEPTAEPTETTIPTIPCTDLSLEQAVVLLQTKDQPWLLNVTVTPADTTDELLFFSSDENVVTVSPEGRVTAVGEGDAVISVICGDIEINCTVAVVFEEGASQITEETEGTDETTGETEGAEATEAPTEAPAQTLKDVTLSVKTTDATFRVRGQQATFKLTCDLEPTEVEWSSENENIVTVDENGVVTCVGKGTTHVVVKYGDQEVKIICRCVF